MVGLSVIGGLDYWTGTTFDPNFNIPYSAKFSRRIILAFFTDMPDMPDMPDMTDMPDAMRWH